jgi:hypothetical protein
VVYLKCGLKGYAEVWVHQDGLYGNQLKLMMYCIFTVKVVHRARVRRDLQSVVQGHLHDQAYIDWCVGAAKFQLQDTSWMWS